MLKEIVFLNGKYIPIEEAKTFLFQPGFLYGWGLFETMRSYEGKIVYLNQHLKRLQDSSKLIKIKVPYSTAKIKTAIHKTVETNDLKDAKVRLNLWKAKRSYEISITAEKYQPYPLGKYKKGFSCQISQAKCNEGSFLSGIKSQNYLMYQLAHIQAKEKGFDEVIMLNNRKVLSQASRSNIFLVKAQDLFTPSLECGALAGITRKAVFDLAEKLKIKIQEGEFSLQDLYHADEIFLTNSLMGIMPVASVEEYWSPNEANKEMLTQVFIKEYARLLKHGD